MRRKLNAAYPNAALRVINHYGSSSGTSAGSEEWHRIVNLLRDPGFADFLNGFGTIADLKASYTQSNPPLLDIIMRMSRLIAPVCRSVLSADSEALVRYFNARDAARMAQADDATLAANSLAAEQGETLGRLETLAVQTLDVLSTGAHSAAQSGPASSPALSLPSDEHYRVDRPELAELDRRLSSEEVVGIGGGGGVGKSLLAVRYARQTRPGKTLYVSLDAGRVRGAMTDLALALGFQVDPDHTDAQVSRVLREALSRYEGLLILDNADDPADVRMLLPNPGGLCRTIVTSRDEALLREVTGADPVRLEEFTPEQARGVFRSPLGPERWRDEEDEIDQLCEMLGFQPIAVDVASASIAAEDLSVSSWLEMYPDESHQLEALVPESIGDRELSAEEARGHRIVHAVLRLSLRGLGDAARGLLYSVACFEPASGGPQSLLLQVAELDPEDKSTAVRELNRLRQRSVLVASEGEAGGRRFSMHRLMREVVRQESGEELGEHEARFFSVMAAFPGNLSRLVTDNRSTDAILAFHQEATNLERTARVMVKDAGAPAGVEYSLPRSRAEFIVHVAQFAAYRWETALLRQLLEHAVRDATEQEWGFLEASSREVLGDLDLREARLGDARAHYDEALPIFQEIQARLGEANTLKALGDLDLREDRLGDARARYDEVLPIFREIQARLGEANTLQMLGLVASLEGNDEDAVQKFRTALVIHSNIANWLGVRAGWGYMGQHQLRNGRPKEALAAYQSSLASPGMQVPTDII